MIKRRARGIGAAALVAALSVTQGAGPARLAQAQKKPGAPAKRPAKAVDESTKAPDDTGNGRRIGLRDALSVAVRQNPSLASETIDVGIADAQIAETYGLDDWLIDAGATWVTQRTDEVPGKQFQSPAVDSLSLNAKVSKPLVDGGILGVEATGSYFNVTSRFETNRGPNGEILDPPAVGYSESIEYNPKLQVTFFQPVLRGFGEATRNSGRVKARADREVQEIERENAAGNLVRDVVQAYWELAYAAQEVAIRKQSVALAREQLRITQAGIEVGKLAKTDSLAVEQAIASREEELFTAEQNLAERSIELRRLVGMEIGPGEIELTATDRLDTTGAVPDLDENLAAALENNPELKTIRARGKAATIDVAVTENGLLPQLDFNATAGPQGNSNTLGDAFSNMVTFDAFEITAGVKFQTSIGNHGAKGRAEAARGQLRKMRLTEQDVRAQIAAQVVRAVNLVRSAKKRMDVSATASRLAEQNVSLEKARWEVGRTTNFEVLRRQDELAQSQLREARARADYLKAVAIVESLTGEILGRYGIALAKA